LTFDQGTWDWPQNLQLPSSKALVKSSRPFYALRQPGLTGQQAQGQYGQPLPQGGYGQPPPQGQYGQPSAAPQGQYGQPSTPPQPTMLPGLDPQSILRKLSSIVD